VLVALDVAVWEIVDEAELETVDDSELDTLDEAELLAVRLTVVVADELTVVVMELDSVADAVVDPVLLTDEVAVVDCVVTSQLKNPSPAKVVLMMALSVSSVWSQLVSSTRYCESLHLISPISANVPEYSRTISLSAVATRVHRELSDIANTVSEPDPMQPITPTDPCPWMCLQSSKIDESISACHPHECPPVACPRYVCSAVPNALWQ
jgi:hypothetical protein